VSDVYLHARDAGRGAHDVQLRARYQTRDVLLRARPRGAGWGAHDVQLYAQKYPDYPAQGGGGGPAFPTQFFGLKAYYQSAVQDLCLVAEADAPSGMGGVVKVVKGGTNYVVYLVETGDANASPIRIRTSTGTKSIRKKT
jgi:hypothetical protein